MLALQLSCDSSAKYMKRFYPSLVHWFILVQSSLTSSDSSKGHAGRLYCLRSFYLTMAKVAFRIFCICKPLCHWAVAPPFELIYETKTYVSCSSSVHATFPSMNPARPAVCTGCLMVKLFIKAAEWFKSLNHAIWAQSITDHTKQHVTLENGTAVLFWVSGVFLCRHTHTHTIASDPLGTLGSKRTVSKALIVN